MNVSIKASLKNGEDAYTRPFIDGSDVAWTFSNDFDGVETLVLEWRMPSQKEGSYLLRFLIDLKDIANIFNVISLDGIDKSPTKIKDALKDCTPSISRILALLTNSKPIPAIKK